MSKQYIYTERAHLMCPNMHFGIAQTIKQPFDPTRITRAFGKLSDAHPFLNAVLGFEKKSNRYYYNITYSHKVQIIFHEQEISKLTHSDIISEYNRLTSYDWDLRTEGMLKAVFWNIEGKTAALFVFHHLLADGKAAVNLAIEFARVYAGGYICASAPERLIADRSELPELPFVSRALINKYSRKWRKEKHLVTYDEYHEFANGFIKNSKISHKILEFGSQNLKIMISVCKQNGITVNDYLLTRLMIEEKTDKVIIAQDIRPQLKHYVHGSLGNYSTAMSVICKTDSGDVWKEAKKVHDAVKKLKDNPNAAMTVLSCYAIMDPGLIDALAISCLGGFESKTAEAAGGSMFGYKERNGYSITNLGVYEERSIENVIFIPPASPAIKKTLGVVTVNSLMTVCSSERK